MRSSSPATVRSIAAALHLSPSAVSLALRNSPKISAATRERVMEEALRQGYDGHPLIASWMRRVRGSGETSGLPVVAYVTGYEQEHHDRIAHLRLLFRGVRERAEELGLPLLRFHGAGRSLDWEELNRQLEAGGVSGVLLAPFEEHAPMELPWDRYSLVAIGRSADRPPMHTVLDQGMEAALVLLERLREEGLSRIGFVNDTEHTERFSHSGMAAFLCWQQRLPKAGRVPVLWAHPNEASEQSRLRAWAEKYRLEAVISHRNLVEFPCAHPVECLRFGMSLGQFNFRERRGTLSPDFEMGRAALETLAGQIHRHETGLPGDPVEVGIPVRTVLEPGPPERYLPEETPRQRTPQKSPVTLREIAAALKISPATVSLALRDDPRVAARTRDRVRACARRLGHAHNPLLDAWALRYHETHRHRGLRIAHVHGAGAGKAFRHPRFAELENEITHRAEALLATVERFPIQEGRGPGAGRVLDIIRARGIDAVIWGPFPPGAAPPPETCRDLVMVGIGESSATAPLDRVVLSRYLSLRNLLRELAERGFRRPGLAGFGPGEQPDVLGWVPAFLQEQESRSPGNRVPWLPLRTPDAAVAKTWVRRHRPDVLLTPWPRLARALAPLECVLIEDSLLDPPAPPPALRYPAAPLGAAAVNLLISRRDLNLSGLPRDPARILHSASPLWKIPGEEPPG